MKTSRWFRIFMMALDTVVLFFLRMFRRFDHLYSYEPSEQSSVKDEPHSVAKTTAEALGIECALEVDGTVTEEYRRTEEIYFAPNEPYTNMRGIVTFRGDNVRSGATYGTFAAAPSTIKKEWSIATGRLQKGYGKGFWTGSGWTGQPLIVCWDDEIRKLMNIYPHKKQKENLTEAIYSTMDGNVYFIDVEDGERTRDDLHVGLPFKGAGAIDPRGIPMLYLGPGDSCGEESARGFIYSLIDFEKLYEFGANDPFALRKFHGYDSSVLVSEKTDTLIAPGENGIIYTMKLNTNFDKATGKLSINPSEFVKLRYKTYRSSEQSYWLGMEDSGVIWKNYLYIADNGGNLMCIDLNTMKLVWAQDVVDDTNGSPVMSVEDNVPYIYIATSLHWTASRRLKLGDVPIFKINAITGEYVWRHTYLCNTVAGISGGVQATCINGKHSISDLVIFPVARTPQVRVGIIAALDKKSGKEVWRYNCGQYAWSSPVDVYDQEGNAFIVTCNSAGEVALIDGRTGKLIDSLNLGSNIEASPAVFGNMLVVGTRGQEIVGLKLS
ncbi:MAG: PQQ-binding-like beta-propeller repeat protein [Christensenella sp.]